MRRSARVAKDEATEGMLHDACQRLGACNECCFLVAIRLARDQW